MSTVKKIDAKSGNACHSSLNIFSVPPTNISINRSQIREILPLNTIDETPYEFRVFSDNQWIDLSRTYLYLEVKIQKKHNNNWVNLEDADTEVGPIQSLGQSFVRQLKVSINNTDVYDSTNLYPFLSYVRNELSYSNNVKDSVLSSIGYYRDSEQDNADSDGFKKRVKLMKNSKVCEFLSRLDFDLAYQSQYLINNVDVHFTIYKSDDDFLIQTLRAADVTEYRLNLISMKMFVKTIDVQPSLNVGVLKMLENNSAKYALRKMEIRSCYLSAGRTEITFNAFTGVTPRRLICMFVNNSAYKGARNLSPYNFKPYNVRELTVNVGGLTYPAHPYSMNFGDRPSFMRAFMDMHNYSVTTENQTNGITIDQYKNGWTFFVMPLSSTLDDCGGFELMKYGTTTIRAQFSAQIEAPGVMLLVIGEFDQLISIDQSRVVLADGSI